MLCLFKNIKTAVNDNECCLAEDINSLFVIHLCTKGLNLDDDCCKKCGFLNFVLYIPELLENLPKKSYTRKLFVEKGMIDKVTKTVLVFDKSIGTCACVRWVYF